MKNVNKNINATAVKVNKITIKRNTAAAADSISGVVNWKNIRFNVVNLTTGEQLLESRWNSVAKGDKVSDMLPYYAAAAALAECKRLNGKITGVVNDCLNDKELTAAAAAVREAKAEYTAAAAEYSRMKKSIFEYLDGVATAAASRRFHDNATEAEIAAAAKNVELVDNTITAYNINIEYFSRRYAIAVEGMTDAPDIEKFLEMNRRKNDAAAALKTAKNDEITASDNWTRNYYNNKNN